MKKEILNPKIKTALAFLLLGAVVITCGCKDKEPEETPTPFVSESYLMVDEDVELRLKKVGNRPDTVVVPLAIYFEYEFEKLIDESRTLVFYDMRGRGRSSAVSDASKLGMDFEISDLEALRLHLGKEKISLIGWSYLGAMVVLYAAQYPDRVDRVIQVGALAPSAEIQKRAISTPMVSESQALLDKLREEGLDKTDPKQFCEEYKNIYMRRIFYDPSKISLFLSDRCKCENEMPTNMAAKLDAIFASIGEWNWKERIRDLNVPVLAIHGAQDPSCPLDGARTWVSWLRKGRLVVIPKAGHMPFIEQPELFYPSVDVFLKGEWPESAEVLGVPVRVK
jgi:proline iminopeptidase